MCCRCCTTLRVGAIWGAAIHIGVGLLLLIGYFVIDEALGDFKIPYLVYVSLLSPIGALILFSVLKEIDWLLRGACWIFILNQIFGFAVRLLVPAQKTSWTILQRIATLFIGILLTAIYSVILILLGRKLRKVKRAAKAAALEQLAAAQVEQGAEEELGDEIISPNAGPSRSNIEDNQ